MQISTRYMKKLVKFTKNYKKKQDKLLRPVFKFLINYSASNTISAEITLNSLVFMLYETKSLLCFTAE